MRWKMLFAVPILLLPFLAANANAQERTHPIVTITIPDTDQHAVKKVTVEGQGIPAKTYQPEELRTQYLVGILESDPSDNRYRLKVTQITGGAAEHVSTFSYEPVDPCNNGAIVRISCAINEVGLGLSCSAMYDHKKPTPDVCEGTVACRQCGRITVCGSKPACY